MSAVWVDMGGRQYGRNRFMNRLKPRHPMLDTVGDLDMGPRVTNVRFQLALTALPYVATPPRTVSLYRDDLLVFVGLVDSIAVGAVITVTARA